jgi:hypothetical protein
MADSEAKLIISKPKITNSSKESINKCVSEPKLTISELKLSNKEFNLINCLLGEFEDKIRSVSSLLVSLQHGGIVVPNNQII